MRTLSLSPRASAAVAATLIAACAARPDAKPGSPGDSSRAGSPDTVAKSVATAPEKTRDSVHSSPGDVTSLRSAYPNVARTLIDPDTSRAHLIAGRNAHDSASYQSAI